MRTRSPRAPRRLAALLVVVTASTAVGVGTAAAATPPFWCEYLSTPSLPDCTGTQSEGTTAAPFWCQWIPAEWSPPDCRPAASLMATTTGAPAKTKGAAPEQAVAQQFAAAGPWEVTTGSATDASGAGYTLFHPTNLGADGVDHPILTWGNGTGSTPSDYTATLTHLASWGFVVIASNSGQTGWGDEILAGAQYLVDANDDPSSPFHQALDVNSIGALGHSQGATGAIHATIESKGLITSTIAINLVDPTWFNPASQLPDLSQLDAPVFFVTGGSDFLSTALAQQRYYDQVPGASAKAALGGGDHDVVQQAGNGYLGYLTAWMKYTLDDDAAARQAFVGSPSEVESNPAWRDQAHKDLP